MKGDEAQLEGQLPIGARVELGLQDDAVALADPLRVTQVLDNLVTNALRYGGAQVHVRAARSGGVVHLIVSDNGPGVPDDLVDTLFDAYVRGAASPGLGGSGLGLLIARKLCEAMGGSLSYTHAGGARFTATFAALPVATAPVTGRDVAPAGHSVAFWTATDVMTRDLTTYVAHVLVRGEAVVVAATAAHHDLHRDLAPDARLRRDRRPLRTAGQRPSRTRARGLLERPAARGRLRFALRLPAPPRAGRPCAVRLSRRRRGP